MRVAPSRTKFMTPGPLPNITAETDAQITEAPLVNAVDQTLKWVTTAKDLLDILRSDFGGGHWIFRGHSRSGQSLSPSLERYANAIAKPGGAIAAETHIVREFKRRAHHYIQNPPGDSEDLEWLALMQHHGAPTRLLDWTRSPYVAAFFAAEPAERGADFAIWVIDRDALIEAAFAIIQNDLPTDSSRNISTFVDYYRQIFEEQTWGHGHFFVAPIEPFRMNERLTIQQGLFLCPNTPLIYREFEWCLKYMRHHASERAAANNSVLYKPWVHKLEIDSGARLGVLAELQKMNVNRATLFPGLDGFASSLRINWELAPQHWFDSWVRSEKT